MIDVLKRLADLDSANPRMNKVSESNMAKEDIVDECGVMGGMGEMHHTPMTPPTPASINMTAGSADELGNLLKDIVSLAGMKSNVNEPMGDIPDGEPVGMLEPTAPEPSPVDSMRSVIDKLNPDDDDSEEPGDEEPGDEEPVDEYDNTPSDPTSPPPFDSGNNAHQENQPGQGDRMDGNMPKGIPTLENVEKTLLSAYRKFIQEE